MKKWFAIAVGVCLLCASCSSSPPPSGQASVVGDVSLPPADDVTDDVIAGAGGIRLGEPLAVELDFDGNLLIGDGAPGRVVRLASSGDVALEFGQPTSSPGFYPSDLRVVGFFVYAVDRVGRTLLRFDNKGAYRDQLVNFEEAFEGVQITPVGLGVGPQGHIAVTDVRNHQIILFDSYLVVELVFGSYGSFPGQFDSPEGIAFTKKGDLVVVDSGNRRVQFLDASGRHVRSLPPEGAPNPLQRPRRAVVTAAGETYVADPAAGRVFVFDGAGIRTRAIAPADGKEFTPSDVAVAADGRIYVSDLASGSIMVFR